MWIDKLPWIKQQLDNWSGSMDNKPGGWSSKKLTALGAFIVAALLSLGWGIWAFVNSNWDILLGILPIWIGIVYGALRINSKEKEKGIAEVKENPKTEDKKDEPA